MKLARCLDTHGQICWAEPVSASHGILCAGSSPFKDLRPGATDVQRPRPC